MIDIRSVTEADIARVLKFCADNGRRQPSDIGTSVLAENRETGEIVGFFHIAPKLFLDPLVIDAGLGKIERVKILERLCDVVSGILTTTPTKQIYFTAEGDEFVALLEKKYDVKEFTKETTYVGEF